MKDIKSITVSCLVACILIGCETVQPTTGDYERYAKRNDILSDAVNMSTDEKLRYLLEHGYPDDTRNIFEKSGKKTSK